MHHPSIESAFLCGRYPGAGRRGRSAATHYGKSRKSFGETGSLGYNGPVEIRRCSFLNNAMSHSDHPSQKRIELRQHQRQPVPPTCLLSFSRFALSISFSGDAEGEGAVVDLSSKGCKVESEASVKVGDAMSLIVLLPGQPAPASVDLALLRWAKGECFGLEFISITPADAKRLHEFLASAGPHDR